MKLVVVGGGVAGLAAAHRAVELARERRLDLDLTLLEARDRLGGTIETEQVDGFLVESGPDSFLSEKPWALALCRRLGVEDRLVRTDDRFHRTFVWHGGRLHPLPDGFQLLAPTHMAPFLTSSLFSWPGKLRMALDLVLPRGTPGGDETLGAFVRRRLGREALERVAQPLVAGIYTADPDELSLGATMPRFLELERRERSVILALWRASRRAPQAGTSGARWSLFVTFARGMSELIDTLVSRLPAGAARLKGRVSALERRDDRWRIALEAGDRLDADRVIVATEAHATARLLRYVDPQLAALLGGIAYASSATVSLAYRRADVPHPLDGFGFVVPREERRTVLACTFSSVKYPGRAPEGFVLLRAFVGGALGGATLQADDGEIAVRARADLADALGVVAPPVLELVHRHPASMPQYHLGHLDRVGTIERKVQALPGLALAGGAYRGVGIADCVHSGERAAEEILGGGLRPPSDGREASFRRARRPASPPEGLRGRSPRSKGGYCSIFVGRSHSVVGVKSIDTPSPSPSAPPASSPSAPSALSAGAQRVQDALRALGFAHEVKESGQAARTAAEAARAVGCDVGQIAKSLVFKTGKTGRAVLVITSGANRVNEWRVGVLLKETLEKAPPAFVHEHAGYAVGGIPPVGHAKPMETFIDEDLLRHPTIWAAAGAPNALFHMPPADLVAMTGGRVIRVK